MSKRTVIVKVISGYRNRVMECRLRAMLPRQADLARMTGIHRSTINALENNRLFLSSPYALLIAEALGCSLDDLFEKKRPLARVVGAESRSGKPAAAISHSNTP